jgi:selenocysteine lyase/cysteine desulfurase
LAEGVKAKGYELFLEHTEASGSGIVSFRHPTIDCRVIVSDLKQQRITAAPRQGWVRMSPHFYTSPAAIEEVLEALPRA